MKRNGAIIGFFIGAILPCIGFMIMYFLWGKSMSLAEFINHLKFNHDNFAKVLAMSLLINLVPFVILNSKRSPLNDALVRGIVVATMIYAAIDIMMKFVW